MVLTSQKQALDTWQRRIANATRNMLDLTNDFTYTMVRDPSPGTPHGLQTGLQGQTRAKLLPAVRAFDELWGLHQLVEDVIAQAQQHYEAYQAWEHLALPQRWLQGDMDAQQVAREIDRLLTTPSIQLPTVQTPLAQRRLADAAETAQTISPDTLFRLMEAAFALLNGLIAEIDAVWQRWTGRLQTLETTVEHMTRLAHDILGDTPPTLLATKQRLAVWRSAVLNDPLSVSHSEGEALEQAVTQTQEHLEALQQQRATFPEQLAAARQTLEQLCLLGCSVQETWDEVHRKVVQPQGVGVLSDTTRQEELQTRLAHIQDAAATGQWRPAVKALAIWQQQAEGYRQHLAALRTANQAPLARRADLRDLLGAWETKAQAYQLIEHPDLAALSQRARAILYARPSDLVAAEQLVAAYARRLSALHVPGHGARQQQEVQ